MLTPIKCSGSTTSYYTMYSTCIISSLHCSLLRMHVLAYLVSVVLLKMTNVSKTANHMYGLEHLQGMKLVKKRKHVR